MEGGRKLLQFSPFHVQSMGSSAVRDRESMSQAKAKVRLKGEAAHICAVKWYDMVWYGMSMGIG